MTSSFKPLAILRDAVILLILLVVVGLVVPNLAVRDPSTAFAVSGGSGIVIGVAGFVSAARLAPGNRWLHLGAVAILVWLAMIGFVASSGPLRPGDALIIAAIVLIAAVIGGGLSYLFRRHRPASSA